MKQNLNMTEAQSTFNKVVKHAYYNLLRNAKQLLSTLEQEEFRYTLWREDRSRPKGSQVIHEIVNPLFYLRLECCPDNTYAIHYGFEQVLAHNHYSQLTSAFVRSIYQYTAKANTAINIESAVRTDWTIKTCTEMYEYLEENNKHHTFKLIPHRQAIKHRKQMQAVA